MDLESLRDELFELLNESVFLDVKDIDLDDLNNFIRITAEPGDTMLSAGDLASSIGRDSVAYCAMKLLPYGDKLFEKYKTCSVQEFRFLLSEKIREQVFITI